MPAGQRGALDRAIILFEGGGLFEQGVEIRRLTLRRYTERVDEVGTYYRITALVEADDAEIEMLYDEGYDGEDCLERAADFITNSTGPAGIILRAVLEMRRVQKGRQAFGF